MAKIKIVEEKIFEKALTELREYAEKHGMILITGESSIKLVKDITKEVEDCMFDVIWQELRDAEKVCEKSCLITHNEPTRWQRECVEVCLKCWEMTKRSECAEKVGADWVEHLYAMETILKSFGLWYHSYWRVAIDEKVFFVVEFKPPPELQEKT
jgi:hypothetical protein